MSVVEDARDISRIAYGFLGSKALFAGLHLDVFTHVAAGADTTTELAAETGAAATSVETLMAALASLGLVVRDGERWINAPAASAYLVRGAPGDFADYFRVQIDEQIYPMMTDLVPGLTGGERRWSDGLAEWLADPAEAERFTRSQHAGSVGAAEVLARRVDLASRRTLLDVGGGSGAFSFAFCRRNPELSATVLDFPGVTAVAAQMAEESGLGGRVSTQAGNALATDWPAPVDAVLMSYFLSAIPEAEIDRACRLAHDALRPGGAVIVHDFMLNAAGDGPTTAALWFVTYLANSSGTASFSAEEIAGRLSAAGFRSVEIDDLIPDLSRVVIAERP